MVKLLVGSVANQFVFGFHTTPTMTRISITGTSDTCITNVRTETYYLKVVTKQCSVSEL